MVVRGMEVMLEVMMTEAKLQVVVSDGYIGFINRLYLTSMVVVVCKRCRYSDCRCCTAEARTSSCAFPDVYDLPHF